MPSSHKMRSLTFNNFIFSKLTLQWSSLFCCHENRREANTAIFYSKHAKSEKKIKWWLRVFAMIRRFSPKNPHFLTSRDLYNFFFGGSVWLFEVHLFSRAGNRYRKFEFRWWKDQIIMLQVRKTRGGAIRQKDGFSHFFPVWRVFAKNGERWVAQKMFLIRHRKFSLNDDFTKKCSLTDAIKTWGHFLKRISPTSCSITCAPQRWLFLPITTWPPSRKVGKKSLLKIGQHMPLKVFQIQPCNFAKKERDSFFLEGCQMIDDHWTLRQKWFVISILILHAMEEKGIKK